MTDIYLDNGMATRPSEKAVSAMIPYYTNYWGSPAAPHQKGQQLFSALKESYQEIYHLLGAKDSDTIVFTSSGAEAVNHAIMSAYLDITIPKGKNHFITSAVDEAPALMAIGRLESMGCVGKLVKVNGLKQVTVEALGDVITPRTAMVSLSWGCGLTGVIQPVAEIAAFCKERGILFHLDATHVLGKLYFDLEDVQADLISFGGDLFHGPKGSGGLYIKDGVKCSSFIVGGMEQGGKRAGTLDVPQLIGLGVAAKEAFECRDLLCMEVARLRDMLEDLILSEIPEATVFFKQEMRLPHCTAIGFSGLANEALLYRLNRSGVYASIGGGSFQQLGLILEGAGFDETVAHSAVSFSLSRETTEADIENAAKIIINEAKKLSEASLAIIKGGKD